MGTAEAITDVNFKTPCAALPQFTLDEWKLAGCPAGSAVRVAGDADLDADYEKLAALPCLTLEFPSFTDGRAFSHARKLRELGFRGELLAGGEVLPDQWQYLQRCGFDAIADAGTASEAAGLRRFSDAYQGDSLQPLPRFRR